MEYEHKTDVSEVSQKNNDFSYLEPHLIESSKQNLKRVGVYYSTYVVLAFYAFYSLVIDSDPAGIRIPFLGINLGNWIASIFSTSLAIVFLYLTVIAYKGFSDKQRILFRISNRFRFESKRSTKGVLDFAIPRAEYILYETSFPIYFWEKLKLSIDYCAKCMRDLNSSDNIDNGGSLKQIKVVESFVEGPD